MLESDEPAQLVLEEESLYPDLPSNKIKTPEKAEAPKEIVKELKEE